MRSRVTELTLGIGALAISWVVASRASVPGWETRLTLSINAEPDWFTEPLWPIMQLGNVWMVAAVPLGLWLGTRRLRPALAGGLAAAAAWGLAKVIKEQVGRGRPADYLSGIDVREAGVHGLGFVSGHAAVAFASATVIAAYLPVRWRPLPFLLAAVTGIARVYYGAHLPLDIVGGAGLGLVCGALALVVLREPPQVSPPEPAGAVPAR